MMLTNELIRVRVKGKVIEPIFLKYTPKYSSYAEQLVDLFQHAEQRSMSRSEIEEIIRDLTALEVDHKILKGLSKTMLDRCDFVIPSLPLRDPPAPSELRMLVFQKSAEEGLFSRVSMEHRKSRQEVLEEVCAELNTKSSDRNGDIEQKNCITPKQLEAALYADLKELHILSNYNGPTEGRDLIERYNLSMCQALLLKATSVVVNLPSVDIKWLRFLFRYIKFHQLIYAINVSQNLDDEAGAQLSEMVLDEDELPEVLKGSQVGVSIKLDGPQSLFKQSTRYGMQLALFLPALVTLQSPWSLHAEVLWGKKRKFKKQMRLDESNELKSHYKPSGTWRSRAEEVFEERYAEYYSKELEQRSRPTHNDGATSSKRSGKKKNSKPGVLWRLNKGHLVLGKGQQVFFPDFCFSHMDRFIFMEVVGFWRGGDLKKKIKAAPKNYIFMVSRRLAGDAKGVDAVGVVDFAEVISLPKVLEKLREISRLNGFDQKG